AGSYRFGRLGSRAEYSNPHRVFRRRLVAAEGGRVWRATRCIATYGQPYGVGVPLSGRGVYRYLPVRPRRGSRLVERRELGPRRPSDGYRARGYHGRDGRDIREAQGNPYPSVPGRGQDGRQVHLVPRGPLAYRADEPKPR